MTNIHKKIQEIMLELEKAGWKKAQDKSADQVTDVDIKSVFNLVDIDKSGTVSRTVSFQVYLSIKKNMLIGSKNGSKAS